MKGVTCSIRQPSVATFLKEEGYHKLPPRESCQDAGLTEGVPPLLSLPHKKTTRAIQLHRIALSLYIQYIFFFIALAAQALLS